MMLFVLLFYPLEISLNADQNYVRFLRPEILLDPTARIFIPFAQVARLTSRDDVYCSIARIRHCQFVIWIYWNMMFLVKHSENIKQRRTTPAIGTCTIPVIETTIPILSCKTGRLFALASDTALSISYALFWMIFVITALAITLFVPILFSITLISGAFFLWIFFLPTKRIFPISFFKLIGVIVSPFFGLLGCTCSALRLDTVSSVWSRAKKDERFGFAAFGAALSRSIHSILTNAISHDVVGQSGMSAAFSRSYSLGHKEYFTA